MKKTILLVAAGAFLTATSCDKANNQYTKEKTHCETCNAEAYLPPSNGEGEWRMGYFDGREITYQVIDGMNILEGDIILTDDQIQDVNEKGTITTSSSKIWPGGVVYYRWATGLDQATKDKFNAAKAHWESVTDVSFVYRSTQANYIEVINGSGCYSYIGMIGGKQTLSIGSGCSSGNAIHEIGHAVGMYHEHTRTDRNTYVTVNTGNIQTGKENNFTICSSCTANGTLDFGSVMMYGSYSFSKNGLPTIVKKNGSTFSVQRNALSTNDKNIINTKY